MSVTISEGQKRLEVLLPALEEHRKFKNQRWPVRSNYASKMGHACERYLFYMRHDWDKAEEKDWKGVGIRGNLIADHWKRARMEDGFKVVHDQLPLSNELYRTYQIAGRIDGRIGWGDAKPMIYEFKTMSEPYYSKINSYQDMFESKAEWIRGYPAQLQLYLMDLKEGAGLFILCNPDTLEWKALPVYFDESYTDWLLSRAKRINEANAAGRPLPRIPYCRTCERCEFRFICLPDVKNEGLSLIDNERLESLLQERAALKESRDRFEELDEEAKMISQLFEQSFVVGTDWKVDIRFKERTRIDTKLIPIQDRAQFEVTNKVKEIRFVPIKPG